MKPVYFLLFFCLLLAGCSPTGLPSINDPVQLAKDCDMLIATSASDQISSEQWPDSVKALKPVSVVRNGQGIIITTFAETGVGARGYIVSRGNPPTQDHYIFSPTSAANIYRFEFKP